MTSRLGRRSGAAAVLLTALLLATPGSQAAAAEGGAPVITIDSPRADPPLDSSVVTVTGSVAVDSLLYRIKEVTLAVGAETRKVDCPESPCRFSWRVTRPLNGPYQLKVTATQATILLGTAGPSGEQIRRFAVAAPPARPVLDPPKVTDGRMVELSWTRNTEADLLYYAIFRKVPGGVGFLQIGGKIPQPPAGKVTFTDTTAALTNGGDLAYQVVAVRKGASGTADTEARSLPSAPATATVSPLPSSTTAVPGAPTTGRTGPAAGVGLPAFLSRPQPNGQPTITLPQPPDTGYDATLPFGPRPAGEELEEGEMEAVPPPRRSTTRSVITEVDRGRPLVPVAGGLVLLLMALHMRMLNRRIKPAANADLPVETGAPLLKKETAKARRAQQPASVVKLEPLERVEPEPVQRPEPEPERKPEPAFYDVMDEADWADPESDPKPEPEPEREPDPQATPTPAQPRFYDVMHEPDWAGPDAPGPSPGPDPEPEAVPAYEPVPEPEFESHPLIASEWAPPAFEEPPPEELPAAQDYLEPGPDEIEVFEVVSPTRRRLARAGSR